MIKAVFLDFDYTVYSHRSKCIPRSAKTAIFQLKKNGIKVFLATGRNLQEMALFPEYKDFHFDGYVLLNGQLCLDGEFKKVFSTHFNEEARQALVKIFNSKKLPMVFIEEDDIYINYNDPEEETRANGDIACLKHQEKEYSGNPLFLAVTYVTREEESQLLSHLPSCSLKRWSDSGVDIVSEGSDKAKSIERFINILGIKREECMMVGDSYNDVDMVKFGGIGVAMGNSVEELKAVADYTTADIDEDGLQKAFKHYNLI